MIFRVLSTLLLLLASNAVAGSEDLLCGPKTLWRIFAADPPIARDARQSALNEITELWAKRSHLDSAKLEARRFFNQQDWSFAQKKFSSAPWTYYGELAWKDWNEGAAFIAQDAGGAPLSEELLKEIHRVSNAHNSFQGFYQRRAGKEFAFLPQPYDLLGSYRIDPFVHNGEFFSPTGERHLTYFEIKRALKNPFLTVGEYEPVANGFYKGAIYYPAPSVVDELTKNAINSATHKLSKVHSTLDKIRIISEMERDLLTIHPFLDGNGRTIRLFTDLAYSRLGLPTPYITDRWDIFMTVDERIGFTLRGMLEHAKQAQGVEP